MAQLGRISGPLLQENLELKNIEVLNQAIFCAESPDITDILELNFRALVQLGEIKSTMGIQHSKMMPLVFINDANLLHISLILGDLDTFSYLVTHYPYLLKSTQQKFFYTETDQNPIVMD